MTPLRRTAQPMEQATPAARLLHAVAVGAHSLRTAATAVCQPAETPSATDQLHAEAVGVRSLSMAATPGSTAQLHAKAVGLRSL